MTTISAVKAITADVFGVRPSVMEAPEHHSARGGRSSVAHSHPRLCAYAIARFGTDASLTILAREFGCADHTSIFYGIRSARKLAATNPTFRTRLKAVCDRIDPALFDDLAVELRTAH